MKVTELIRGLLDIIDNEKDEKPQVVDYEEEVIVPKLEPEEPVELSNSPNEIYATLDMIDQMGQDVNGPATTDQIKTATFPMFFGLRK
jgi:hypothetical protein